MRELHTEIKNLRLYHERLEESVAITAISDDILETILKSREAVSDSSFFGSMG